MTRRYAMTLEVVVTDHRALMKAARDRAEGPGRRRPQRRRGPDRDPKIPAFRDGAVIEGRHPAAGSFPFCKELGVPAMPRYEVLVGSNREMRKIVIVAALAGLLAACAHPTPWGPGDAGWEAMMDVERAKAAQQKAATRALLEKMDRDFWAEAEARVPCTLAEYGPRAAESLGWKGQGPRFEQEARDVCAEYDRWLADYRNRKD